MDYKKVWKRSACLVAGLAVFGLADNPISSYHYLADPSCASDGDTFYILTDVDDYNNQTNWNYDIVGLYAFTSEDMKNWTDHGMIFLQVLYDQVQVQGCKLQLRNRNDRRY